MSKILTGLIVVAFFFFFRLPVNAQVLNGNITLSTQADVDAFAYTEVNGMINISGSSITNLNGLSELTKCNTLNVFSNANLTSIIGLASLEEVTDDLIFRNNGALVHLVGLSSLTTVGTAPPDALIIENNDNMVDIDGLFSLTFAHSLKIIGNAKLADVDGLSALEEVADFFTIKDNPLLTNLNALSNFTTLSSQGGNLTIDNNDALVSISGLSNLSHLPGLIVQNNLLLSNLDGLSKVTAMIFGGLTIENNPALTNIDGLGNITTANCDVKINNNPALLSIGLLKFAGVNDIAGAMSMEIKNNNALTNLDGLSSMVAVKAGHFYIEGNFNLQNINGLSKLNLVGNELTIRSNSHLENVDGLSSLEAVAGLAIEHNNMLTNLNGLSKLKLVVYDLVIRFNPVLIDFCGLSTLFDEGEIGRNILISGNGANTVSITPPPDIILNNDPGLCSKDISSVVPYNATVYGCLNPAAPSHSDYPAGNIFPVGTTNIVWSVYDGAGNSSTAIQQVIISDNEAPVITGFPNNTTVACASDVPAASISSVTATDNCPNVTITHVGDVITNQTCANRYTLTRTYKATDGSGNTTTRSQIITVNDNIPPQINNLATSKQMLAPPNHKMQDITVDYTVTDNCNTSPTYSIAVISSEPVNGTGDGDTDPDWEIIDDHHIRLRAERAANGTGRIYTITVTASDGCNAPVTSSVQVVVAHNITAPHSGQAFKAGSTVAFSGEFWDVPANKHTAKWLIDDNTTAKASVAEPSGNKNGKVTGSNKFSSPGVYKLQMDVTDQNGITTFANTNGDLEAIIVIYDPNDGYTYGGGYFNSPAGALVSNSSAAGKASYGFSMNYFKNSTYPKGETQFEFKVGGFEFNALNFDYLVISNSVAQFKGTGKIIGGQSGVGFTMTVVDGQLDGTGVDKIRMKIYNKNNGAVIYDNQFGASDTALPTQAVGSNSIIVISGTNSSLTKSGTTQKTEMEAAASEASNELDVIAYPNPTSSNFNISVRGSNKNDKITMQIVDIYGRIIETRNVNADSQISFGNRYNPGTYFVRIMQGKEHKEIKLMKLSD